MKETTLRIEGMSCQMCVKHVTQALQGLEGVKKAEVDLTQGIAQVQYEPNQVGLPEFRTAVSEAGYLLVE